MWLAIEYSILATFLQIKFFEIETSLDFYHLLYYTLLIIIIFLDKKTAFLVKKKTVFLAGISFDFWLFVFQ